MPVTVFNVGQGDSSQIAGMCQCSQTQHPLLVDCGPKKALMADRLVHSHYDVLITHADHDHIAGLSKIIKTKTIETLYIPYYLPEVMRIATFLIKHLPPRQIGKIDWKKAIARSKITLLGYGDEICRHTKILNPPKPVSDHFSPSIVNSNVSITAILDELEAIGVELSNKEEIVDYQSPLLRQNLAPDNEENYPEYSQQAKQFVHSFFRQLLEYISSSSKPTYNYRIAKQLNLTANQASIVFRLEHPEGDWLFTGDADKKVFRRLIKENCNISAKYFKVPHHGSRRSLSTHIIGKICPEIGIVSHNNRVFGPSKDGHPHHEIIDLLEEHCRKTYYTNDVIKGKVKFADATSGSVENGLILFE